MSAEPQLPSVLGVVGVVGVVGAGTMGAGIAQLALTAGITTLLHDPVPAALERGVGLVEAGLQRLAAKGRLTERQLVASRERLLPAADLAELADCELVIEAAPERLELKRELFARLAEVVRPDCVIATNTSSLSVSELAAPVPNPGRVVGLHFFNPAPVMRLVEVVAGEASSGPALALARAVGAAMGKHVIDAADIPGFVVNRCNRPYSLESLRVLEARVATPEQIDRIARMAGRFRMGPFELIDLIGLDTNHAVAEVFYRQTFGEPRYQPSPLQARAIAAGRLGRKTGRGWYEYGDGAASRPSDPEPPSLGGGDGRTVSVIGELPVAGQLRSALRAAGFAVLESGAAGEPWLTLVCGGAGGAGIGGAGIGGAGVGGAGVGGAGVGGAGRGPRARLLVDGSLHATDPQAAGFHLVPPLASARLIEITSTPVSDAVALQRLREMVAALGCVAEHVDDVPGLVLGRIVCQLINEAAFLVGSGNASPADVDAGMELGVNHPRGPAAWCRELGVAHVVAVLGALHRELGEERYRIAPLLARAAALGRDPFA